jgi:hypothetical protein
MPVQESVAELLLAEVERIKTFGAAAEGGLLVLALPSP